MPAAASPAKVEASRGYGAEVVLHGETSIQAFAKARELEAERGLTFVHPFDDAQICAGAGTTGLELLEQVEDLDVVVIPIGGGGLIGGMLPAIKESNPKHSRVRRRADGRAVDAAQSRRGHAVRLEKVNTIADGLAAPMMGELPLRDRSQVRGRRRAARRRRDRRRDARAAAQHQAARRAGRRGGDGRGASARDSDRATASASPRW